MTFRTTSVAAVLALLGFAAVNPASAQPVPPAAPPRPAFSPYLNMLGPWGPGFGYFGIAQPQMDIMQQQFQIQQQLQATSQNLANFQNAVNSGLVNPFLPATGRGATFNNLSHYFPGARNSGGGGFGGYGGYGAPRMQPRAGLGAYGSAMGGANMLGGLMNMPIRR